MAQAVRRRGRAHRRPVRRARGAPWSSSSATTSAVAAERVGDHRAGGGGVGGDQLAVALADQQLAGGRALRVELGEALQGGAVGATGGSDDDGWIEAGHGWLLGRRVRGMQQ